MKRLALKAALVLTATSQPGNALGLDLTKELPVELNFQHLNEKYEKTVFLEFDQKSSFDNDHGIKFEVTPRKLYRDKIDGHRTVVLELKITDEKRQEEKKLIATPTVSLERGGSATIQEGAQNSKAHYSLSVTSLR
ncbi:hypothetical protein GW915_02345 [bacterium]|nr:hypothetical protein [bacterium]